MAVNETISGDGVFTAGLALDQHTPAGILFSLTIEGVFSGTLTLQMSFDRGQTWKSSEDTFTQPTVKMSVPVAELHSQVRVGFVTGDFSSGSATIRLGLVVVD